MEEDLPSFPHCLKTCTDVYQNITITNGWLHCENDRIRLECHMNHRPNVMDFYNCQDFKEDLAGLECLPISCRSVKRFGQTEECEEETVLLVAGGKTFDENLSRTISIYPYFKNLDQCLPPLPLPLRWGAIGKLGSTLHICGGEDGAEQPQSSCWVLDNQSQETAIWRHHRNMTSARSQCASTVSGDGSSLLIIIGYNYDDEAQALS